MPPIFFQSRERGNKGPERQGGVGIRSVRWNRDANRWFHIDSRGHICEPTVGVEPGLVFDRITNLDGVPDGYRAMNEREAIKVMIEF